MKSKCTVVYLLCLGILCCLPMQAAFASGDQGGCVEGIYPGCDGVCGSGKVFDDCGICDGQNKSKDDCGVCSGKNEDKDCHGVCFGDAEYDECGRCGGSGAGVCGCDLSVVPDSCGVCGGSGPGECGCNNLTKDHCGVCGGDGSSCQPQCNHYLVHNRADYYAFYSGQNGGQPIFSGNGAALGCLNNALGACGSGGQRNRYDFSDDCVAGYLWTNGAVVSTQVTTCYLVGGCDYGLGTGATTWVMNANCKRVNAQPDAMCNLYMDWIVSPISLLWDGAESIEDYTAISRFPLDAGDSAKQFYVWRASAETPLLVYDPEHTGVIEDATSLFGSWTFGGKTSGFTQTALSGNAGQLNGTPWENGYEALSLLDVNRDGRVAGDELAPLALWFDRNADGVSDAGEVISLEEAGVTALFYDDARVNEVTGDVHLAMGYIRDVDGQEVAGRSVDWFAKGYNSYGRAVQEVMRRNSFGASISQKPAVTEQEPKEALGWSAGDPLFGTWKWTITERPDWSTQSGAIDTSGVVFFTDVGSQFNEFLGRSYFEVPVVGDSSGVATTIIGHELKGWKLATDDGGYYYKYRIFDKRGNQTTTKLYIDTDGNSATAESTFVAKSSGKPFSYKWTAKKVLDKMEQYPSEVDRIRKAHPDWKVEMNKDHN